MKNKKLIITYLVEDDTWSIPKAVLFMTIIIIPILLIGLSVFFL